MGEKQSILENAIHHNKQLIHLLDNAGFGIGIYDTDGRILYYNKKALSLIQKDLFEVSGVLVTDIFKGEEGKKYFNRIKKVVENKQIYNYEDKLFFQTEEKWFISTFSPVYDEHDEVCGVQIISNDITTRVIAEERAEKNSRFLDRIMQESPFAMWISDASGTVVKTNKSLREKLNLSDKQIINKYNVLEDENLKKQGVMSKVKAVFNEQKPTRFSIYWKASEAGDESFENGKDLYIDVSMFPLSDKEGNLLSVVCQWIDITDHKKTEIALKESKERAEKYLNVVAEIILVLDSNGTIQILNDTGHKLLGYNKGELIGKNWFDTCLIKETADEIKNVFKNIISGNIEPFVINEDPVLRKDGEIRTILWHNTILRDINGNITGTLSSGEDISEKKKAEEKLQRIFNMASELICEADINTATFTKINPSFSKVLGYSEDELLSRPFTDFIHPDDFEETNRIIQDQLKHGKKVLSFVNRYRCKDGSYVWLDWNSHPVPEKGFTYAIARDITDQKNTQEELLESKERYRSIFEDSHDWVFIHDFKGNFIDANSAALEGMGYTKDELKNLNFTNILYEEQLSKALTETMKLKKLGEQEEGIVEYTVRRKDGSIAYIETVSSLLTKKGVPYAVQGIARDVTDRKIAEEKLREAHLKLKEVNLTLEQKVKDRTEKIQQLLQQKDEFVNQLGHDLKNPLGPLLNLLPLLEKNENDPKRKEMLHVMSRNVDYMKNLVTKTLELAQLKSPNAKLNLESVNISAELTNILEVNQMLFEDHDITIRNHLPDELKAKADRLRIHEVFTNLLNNAVKYSDEGGGSIIINYSINNEFITISIQDFGVGMTTNQIDKIYNEFYKADSSRHEFDSSGLGMPICKRIIEMHGGKIWAESKGLGKGSTFYFTLPKN